MVGSKQVALVGRQLVQAAHFKFYPKVVENGLSKRESLEVGVADDDAIDVVLMGDALQIPNNEAGNPFQQCRVFAAYYLLYVNRSEERRVGKECRSRWAR